MQELFCIFLYFFVPVARGGGDRGKAKLMAWRGEGSGRWLWWSGGDRGKAKWMAGRGEDGGQVVVGGGLKAEREDSPA